MNHSLNLVKTVALIALTVNSAYALDLEIDTAHSNIGFDIKHLMISSVNGNFKEFNGNISLDESKFENTKINFVVKTASINTNNEKRDGHLKSPDFFDVTKPENEEATFTSTNIKKIGQNKYTLTGDLKIHGVTKKQNFELNNLGKVSDPFSKIPKYVFTAKTKIVRKDFGLTYNSTLETGGVLIGDTADLKIDIEAAPKAATTK
ncbi:MAG: YceI family protein [Bdellovibrionales bacterium]|nr:YceI family protein [Bdellovibrionales bacterium]